MNYISRQIRRLALIGVVVLCCVLIIFVLFAFFWDTRASAQGLATAPPLGAYSSFAVLGGTTVTNTGPSVLNGDLGVSPGSAITGFPPGMVHGATHKGDAVALQAQSDVTTAYNSLASEGCNFDLTGQDLGGKALVAGVYCFSSSAQLTGNLQLFGGGVFIFQVGSKLTVASSASVALIGGALPCNVWWQVGSSATIGTNARFAGNVLALTSIAAKDGATFNGGLYARNGAVTLDDNTITRSSCNQATPTTTPSQSPTPTSEVGLG